MAQRSNDDDSPNPPMRIGTPIPPSSLGLLMAWHAHNGTLTGFLIEIGYFYDHPAPGDRDGGRER
jgi:hypothetical protein